MPDQDVYNFELRNFTKMAHRTGQAKLAQRRSGGGESTQNVNRKAGSLMWIILCVYFPDIVKQYYQLQHGMPVQEERVNRDIK